MQCLTTGRAEVNTNHFTPAVIRLVGDFNNDGLVDTQDYQRWNSKGAMDKIPADQLGTPVPEPSAQVIYLFSSDPPALGSTGGIKTYK